MSCTWRTASAANPLQCNRSRRLLCPHVNFPNAIATCHWTQSSEPIHPPRSCSSACNSHSVFNYAHQQHRPPRAIPRTSALHGETLQRTRPRQFGKSAILESVRPQVRDTIFGTSVCWVFPQMLFPMDDSSMRWIWRSFRSAFGLIKLQLDSRQIRFLAGHITSLRLFLCKNQFIHFLTSLLPSLRSGLSRTYLLCGYLIITCIIKKGDWDKQQYHREEEEET